MRTVEKAKELSQKLKAELGEIELSVIGNYTLADAIREGASITKKAVGWGDGYEDACALTAAAVAARARGFS